MTPDTDTSTLRMEMRQLNQNPEEKVSDFAHKIREMASLAFNSNTSNGGREEACIYGHFNEGIGGPGSQS